MLKQKTLKDSFSLSGKGLHTGLDLTVTFNPAPDNHGYKIQRIDLEGQPTIDAVADNVTETTRGTVLSKNGVKVSTVEHGMAALYALGIDNCLIQVNGPEFPILDGSAQYYVQEIERVGTEEQSAVKDFYIIKSKIEFRDEATGSSIIVLPDENFSLNVLVSYDSTIIPNQFATLEDMHKFKDEVAASRTFVFVREIEPLLSAGLIKGGDLDNAIVIYERKMSQESYDKLADVMGVPHMDADQLGYINHKPLVWPNECARHKLLDVIGDLALIGKPIKGRIIATRPGHTINNKFARQMRNDSRGTPLRLGKDEIAIFEGIHALNDDIAGRHPEATGMYISARSNILEGEQLRFKGTWMRISRRAVRDYNFRGTDLLETLLMWYNVRRGEKKYISPYKGRAHVIIDSSLRYEVPVFAHYTDALRAAVEQVPPDNERWQEYHDLVDAFRYFEPVDPALVAPDSLLREFIGGGGYHY